MPKVVSIGHSHMGTLVWAYSETEGQRRSGFELIPVQLIQHGRAHIVNIDGRWCYHPALEREVRAALSEAQPDVVLFMLQGEQAISAGLAPPSKEFRFYFPDEVIIETDDEIETIPFDIMAQIYRDGLRLMSDFLDLVMPHIVVPAFALSAPPPIGDQEIIRTFLQRHKAYEELQEKCLPPAAHRFRLWKLTTLMMRDVYEAHQVSFVEPPLQSVREDGCLRPEYYWDAFHANKAYGELLVQQVGRLVDKVGI